MPPGETFYWVFAWLWGSYNWGIRERPVKYSALEYALTARKVNISTARLLLLIRFGRWEHIGGHVGHGRKG